MGIIELSRTAVVAVHLQNDIVGPDGAFAPLFREQAERVGVLSAAVRVLGAARSAGATVIYTRVAYQPGYTDLVANSPLLSMVAANDCLVDGTNGAAILDEAAPKPGDIVVTQQRVSGFHGTQLDVLLRSAGVATVVLFGVATNVSVESTARAASDLGYTTVVVSDACSAASEAAHNAALESLRLLATVMTSDELVGAFGHQTAGAVRD